MGDFNHPQIDFPECKVSGSNDSPAYLFYETVNEAGLFEQVQTYTRWRDGQQPSRLDYILTSEPHMVEHLTVECPLGRSDHGTITFEWITKVDLMIEDRPYIRNYAKADYNAIKSHLLNTDWPVDLVHLDLEHHWEFLIESLNRAAKLYIPISRPRNHKKALIRSSTKKIIVNKRSAWNAYRQDQTAESRNIYVGLRNQVVACVRRDKRLAQQHLAKSICENPKLFFKTLSTHSKSRIGITGIQTPVGTTSSDESAADALAAHYSTVYRPSVTKLNLPLRNGIEFNAQPITTEAVRFKLHQLQVNKAPGPDMVSPRFLKACADELAGPLTILFNHSLEKGKLPTAWKTFTITPIYKGGARDDPNNYRPVALLSCVSKILESLLDDYIREQLTNLNVTYLSNMDSAGVSPVYLIYCLLENNGRELRTWVSLLMSFT
jgi:hypothetical protein